MSRFGWWWLAGLFAAFGLAFLLSLTPDTATLLTPDHVALKRLFARAALGVGAASAAVGYLTSAGPRIRRIVLAVFVFGLIGWLATASATQIVSNLVLRQSEFPGATTRTVETLLPVGKVYRVHSRRRDQWYIQPAGTKVNIAISQADYNFAIANRRPQDGLTQTGALTSEGYLCAKVSIAQSGDATKVLHAGRERLPEGAIVKCPPAG